MASCWQRHDGGQSPQRPTRRLVAFGLAIAAAAMACQRCAPVIHCPLAGHHGGCGFKRLYQPPAHHACWRSRANAGCRPRAGIPKPYFCPLAAMGKPSGCQAKPFFRIPIHALCPRASPLAGQRQSRRRPLPLAGQAAMAKPAQRPCAAGRNRTAAWAGLAGSACHGAIGFASRADNRAGGWAVSHQRRFAGRT